MNQQKDSDRASRMTEDFAKSPAVFHRLPLTWWELSAYALILVLAFVCSATQSAKWVAAPLVLAVLLVRVARILLAKRKNDHESAEGSTEANPETGIL
ncbi:hypothetical protein [Bifidobacterium tissieri]|uniref:Uncharacterized protein n=1 Tax=Bifidobacterium tissieri TaxID=1630162 RepID=A0A5M9ZZ04_9BIFI|nr:hypothetical protein [Bifidobacterium tissieri]KAA8830783.1 hypothetical protein EMO89_04835 [Bifidobacterium tissieri]KAA8832795.1 hypothetical protein EM849_02680 [Bifidobacterium tissieri]